MPKLKNASRAAAMSFAERVAEREQTGMNLYSAPKEGPGVWYVRPLDYPAPPFCECIAQVLLAPKEE